METRTMYDLTWMREKIQANLTDDLLKPEFRGRARPFAGHCYVASEALYHMTDKILKPKRGRWEGVMHWWLEDIAGSVIDFTAEQFETKPDYKAIGKGGGFLTREPSKRTAELMRRIYGD